jgi:threonine dehydrogenase-like Zn-dependent dehydrogenase
MVELAGRSLLGKARERPDLVREVISRARRDGIASTAQKVRRQLGQDRPLGYSSAGWVIEVGEQVDGLRPGDAVACAGAGHANHAEIVSVPRNLCARVPSGVSLQTAAFTTIASVALHGIRLAEVGIGDQIAVIGCGLVGQIACRLLRTAGAYTIALDIDSDRVASAREGGADAGFVVDGSVAERVVELCDGLGVDAALVTAASRTNDPLILGTAIARDRGMLILVGAVQIDVPYRQFY